jgi:L-aspartate oxidase
LFREHASLRRAVATLEKAWQVVDARLRAGRRLDADGWRATNLVTVARLIARAAERREESRGAHYRDDYPQRDDIHWKRRVKEVR